MAGTTIFERTACGEYILTMRKFFKVLKWMGISFVALLMLAAVALYVITRDISPTDVSDLLPSENPVVAPDDNAFTYFEKAEELTGRPVDPIIIGDFLKNEQVETNRLLEVFTENIEVLKHIEEGVKRKDCVVPGPSHYQYSETHTRKWLGIGRILTAKSRYERIAGKKSEAVSTCVTLLKYASLLQHNANNDIYYLISQGMFGLGLKEARSIAQERSVSENDLSQLLKVLNSFPSLKTNKVRVLKWEYQYDAGKFSVLLKDLFDSWNIDSDLFQDVKIQPNMIKDILAVFYRDYIYNVENFSAAQSNLLDEEKLRKSVDYSSLNLCVMLVNICRYWHHKSKCARCLLDGFYRDECYFSATQLLVALNLYEKKNGELPKDLSLLVPEYINSVPRDPYDGKPYRYDRKKRIIYSVGLNLKDEGGSINKVYRGLSHESSDRYRANDIVFRISEE